MLCLSLMHLFSPKHLLPCLQSDYSLVCLQLRCRQVYLIPTWDTRVSSGRMAYSVIQSDESQWPFQIFLLLPMLRALYQTILLAGIVFGIELGLLRSYKISSGWGGAVEVSCCLLLSPLTSGMLSCSL